DGIRDFHVTGVQTCALPILYYVHGNHDVNYDVESDELSDETWERTFGPATYAYNVGPVHFIVIDNIGYQGQSNKRRYTGRIGPRSEERRVGSAGQRRV